MSCRVFQGAAALRRSQGRKEALFQHKIPNQIIPPAQLPVEKRRKRL